MATTTSARPKRAASTKTPVQRRRALVYLRVSLDSTGERLTVRRHEKACRALCKQRGWEVVQVFTDNSVSAAGKVYRAQFAAMLDAIKQGGVDVVVAWALDRFIRSARDRLTLVEACREHGVLITIAQGGDMDPQTATGRMTIDVIGAAAQMEIDMKNERQIAAALQRAEMGKAPIGKRLFGYTADNHVEPAEAAVVAGIFERFNSGESLKSLARSLTAEGVPTRSGRPWNVRTIRDLLVNPRYAGRAVYQRAALPGVRGNWEALVADEVFDVTQSKLTDPERKTNRVGTDRRYLGSSLYLCDACGGPIATVNGGKYFCSGHVIREHRHVDRFVLDVIAERLSQPDFEKLLAPVGEDMTPVVEESKKLRARLAKVDEDFLNDDIDVRLHKRKTARIQAELREVDKKLATRTGGAALSKVAAAPDPAQAFREASLMAQRAVIDVLCVVRLKRAARGRMRTGPDGLPVFDTDSVVIEWRR